MPDAADLSAQMVGALATVEPQLDTSIGTPVRKILDVIAEQLAGAYPISSWPTTPSTSTPRPAPTWMTSC